jgi:dinuclear metal center YbgI/SA1388 family protein
MVSYLSIVRFLNKYLEIKEFEDYAVNGTQVYTKNKRIKKVGLAVDASWDTLLKAKKEKIDLLICHHGILLKGQKDETGVRNKKIKFLKKNYMNLYGVHLPLDAHKAIGNNILIAYGLGLNDIKSFFNVGKKEIGVFGEYYKFISLNKLSEELYNLFEHNIKTLNFGNKKIKKIGILTGSGNSALISAHKLKFDCLITGEINYTSLQLARELKLNIILGGHHSTERFGVKAVGNILEKKFKLETIFIHDKKIMELENGNTNSRK